MSEINAEAINESIGPNQAGAAANASESLDKTTLKNTPADANASSSWSTDDRFNSLAELKEKAPEVWDKMMLSIANNILQQNNKFLDRMKKHSQVYQDKG